MDFTVYLMWVTILIVLGSLVWNYFRIKKAATYVGNQDFKDLMRSGQLIDIRDPKLYHTKHILGARNFPMTQFNQAIAGLRKDKPVLLYEGTRGSQIGRAVLALKKAGFTDIYVLRDGFNHWDGKTK